VTSIQPHVANSRGHHRASVTAFVNRIYKLLFLEIEIPFLCYIVTSSAVLFYIFDKFCKWIKRQIDKIYTVTCDVLILWPCDVLILWPCDILIIDRVIFSYCDRVIFSYLTVWYSHTVTVWCSHTVTCDVLILWPCDVLILWPVMLYSDRQNITRYSNTPCS
jgi:hypothetical protein